MEAQVSEILGSQRRIENNLEDLFTGQASVAETLREVRLELRSISDSLAGPVHHVERATPIHARNSLFGTPMTDMSSEGFVARPSALIDAVRAAPHLRPSRRGGLAVDETCTEDMGALTLPQAWPSTLGLRPQLQSWLDEQDSHRGTVVASMRPKGSTGSGGRLPRAISTDDMMEANTSANFDSRRAWLQLLREPDSLLQQAVEILAFLLIAYDLMIIPYALAWDLESNTATLAMDWVLVSFWSIDVALSFIKGYHMDGELVMAISLTTRRYLRTWFLPDLVMVVIDWFYVLFMTAFRGSASEEMLKVIKMCKVLRVIDVLRFIRIVKAFESFVERRLDNTFRLVLRLVSITGTILWANHIIACIWFAVGRAAPSDTGGRWITKLVDVRGDVMEYSESSKFYQYATAFHWSITQCTLSYMEVAPSNSAERVMICVCMLLGLIFGSGLVSALSATLVEMRGVARDRSQKISALRSYLVENHVHKKVALFVQRQVTERLRDKGRLTGKDVPALLILSSSARRALHADIIRPHFIRHGLFRLWDQIDQSWFERACAEAADMVFLRPGDDLFNTGISATAAYFLITGRLSYVQEPESAPVMTVTSRTIEQGTWLCEGALWSEWTHVGKAEALTHCQVLVVQSQALLNTLQGHMVIRTVTMDYAAIFHERIVAAKPPMSNWPTDVEVPFTDYGEIMASMPKDMQVAIGLVAVNRLKGPKVLFGGNDANKEMREEVAENRSLVAVSASGEVERLVSAVVLEISRDNGDILMQLGRWEDSRFAIDFQLPSVNRERDELPEIAVQRLVATKLAPLTGRTKVTGVASEVVTADVKWYGIRTKYMRKIYHARLVQAFKAPVCVTDQNAEGSYSIFKNKSINLAELADVLVSLDVYYLGLRNTGIFVCWLPPEEVKTIKAALSEPHVQGWLRALRPPRVELVPMSEEGPQAEVDLESHARGEQQAAFVEEGEITYWHETRRI